MYFDFEDYHPDISPVGNAISLREGVLIAFIVHLLAVIFLLLSPRLFPEDLAAKAARLEAAQQQRLEDQARFVFVQPRLERNVPRAPERAEPSDRDRIARAPDRAPQPTNPVPFSRGNTPERVDEPATPRESARGRGPDPDPAVGRPTPQEAAPDPNTPRIPESQSAMQLPSAKPPAAQNGVNGRSATSGGSLGDALRNLQKYVQNESFDNQGGGAGQFGPEIQFDTKGVEFGPWIRRFIAQVKRNWFIPYAAMSMKGHVVITFNVHKDGSITDLNVVGPCPVDAFNNAAFGALSASNPTTPLPPEYPSDKAFFTVTFLYNETPR
jgi:TonB family protein